MKKPLYDDEMEKALLWTFLTDDNIAEEFFIEYELETFYNNIGLAKAIYSLIIDGESCNLLNVKNWLEQKGRLEWVGWMTGLVEITELAESWQWKTYADKLTTLYKQRAILEASRKLEDISQKEDFEQDIEKTFSSLSAALCEGVSSITNVEDNINLTKAQIDRVKNSGGKLIGWSWWNPWLDEYTGWLKKAKTYRIGAPSWVWKTNLIYQTIISLVNQGAKVMFISLENTIETTYINLLSSLQGVNSRDIENGRVDIDEQWLRDNKDKLIITDQLFNIGDIKREVIKNSPDVVILDYIWLVDIKGCDERTLYNKYADEVKTFVQKQKSFAWIDLSNLNKEDDEERIRKYKGFNGSAKLRNNTDIAIHMFYYEPFYNFKKSYSNPDELEWFKSKQVLTFLLSKNRGWVDGTEETFLINFDEGIRYRQVKWEQKEKWKC